MDLAIKLPGNHLEKYTVHKTANHTKNHYKMTNLRHGISKNSNYIKAIEMACRNWKINLKHKIS
jgi:hypothetical protein